MNKIYLFLIFGAAQIDLLSSNDYWEVFKEAWMQASPSTKKLVWYGLPAAVVFQLFIKFLVKFRIELFTLYPSSESRDLREYIIKKAGDNFITSPWKLLFMDLQELVKGYMPIWEKDRERVRMDGQGKMSSREKLVMATNPGGTPLVSDYGAGSFVRGRWIQI